MSDMRRREFITLLGGAVAWPLAASAQQTGNVCRIGYVAGVSGSAASGSYAAFVQGMRELGYIEGKDFVIEWRSVEGRHERFPEIAAELVRLKVDVFVTGVTAALPALKRATNTIPIVMAYSRPIPSETASSRAWAIPAATSPDWQGRPMTHRQSNWSY
jgi:putative ABC transport system substrate-binding protein